MTEKPDAKPKGLPGHLKPGNPGNSGGKKGRSGRKPDWLKKWCDDLLADPKCKKQVKAILQDKDHPAFKAMWSAVADRAAGKPTQAVTVGADSDLLKWLTNL